MAFDASAVLILDNVSKGTNMFAATLVKTQH